MNSLKITTLGFLISSIFSCGSSDEKTKANAVDMTTQQEENEPSATGNTGDTGSTENNGDTGNTGVDNLALPTWQLKDIQPKSERFGDVYGLDHFKGEVLVALLIEGF